MAEPLIYVLDNDEKQADFFQSMFLRDDYRVSLYDSIHSLLKALEENQPGAVLVEYSTLVSENRSEVVQFFKDHSAHNIFVYNVPDNANRRLAFYELGARRVFDTSQPVEEIHYALLWPLKNLNGELDKNRLFSSGSLEDIQLKTLIMNLAREERTGILKIITKNNSGKIYFRDGHIYHAVVGLHNGEKALLHMFLWHTGIFSFNASTVFNEASTIHLSNVAMILMGDELRLSYIKNLKNIGLLSSIIRVRNSGDLCSSEPSVNINFIELLERPQKLSDILENPYYTSYETANLLNQFMKKDFLLVHQQNKDDIENQDAKIISGKTPAKTGLFTDEEIELIKMQLGLTEHETPKIAIVSTAGKGSYQFLCTLTEMVPGEFHSNNIYMGSIQITHELSLSCYSLSVNKSLLDNIENLRNGLTGFVFLIDVPQKDKFEYYNYMMNNIISNYYLPWLPVLFNFTDDQTVAAIRKIFELPENIPVLQCNPLDGEQVKAVILALKGYETSEDLPELMIDEESEQ